MQLLNAPSAACCSTRLSPSATAGAARGALRAAVLPPQQLRQLGDVGRDASRFVAGKQLGGRSPTGLILEIHIRDRLPGAVTDDKAGVVRLIDRPGWRRRCTAARHPRMARLIGSKDLRWKPPRNVGERIKAIAPRSFLERLYASLFERAQSKNSVPFRKVCRCAVQ
jgi:hypothetical protein